MATTLGDLQRLHNRLWQPQPQARDVITARLEHHGAELSAQNYVELDAIATQIIADRLNIPCIKPEVTAVQLGRPDWLPHIRHVRENIRLGAGGRPRHERDSDLLLALWKSSTGRPEWKAIACEFERQTAKVMTPEACRSAVRRRKARLD